MSARHLLLLGGGHAHLEVVRRLKASPDLKITMVSPQPNTAYSGKLPAVVAGRVREEELWLPLRCLCSRAGIDFCQNVVESLDLEAKRVLCHSGRAFSFDAVSINVGSQPPGECGWGLPVRPLTTFLAQLERVISRSIGGDLVVVGGGAGGVELILALRQRIFRQRCKCRLHLVSSGTSLLQGHCRRAQSLCQKALEQRGVELHLGQRVRQVLPGQLVLGEQQSQPCDGLIWATGASAFPWLAASGLATDGQGFVRVHSNLQSTSHPWVFAAGDAASLEHRPCPKAGVFAVRQGPILAQNLFQFLQGRVAVASLSRSRRYLSLISYGDGIALGSWGSLALQGRTLGWLKDWIDDRWMEVYRGLSSKPDRAL